ncbi:XRE family transcriptional regulator [Candidatus Acetothermia bacterium]|nr:XRE family transcriptional regulator [Candidatus Acetothermia bacterium]
MGKNRHIGSSLDAFLEEEGILSEVEKVAYKRILAWQIRKSMKEKHLSKAEMARVMKTSRAALDRLLDPRNGSVTLRTIERAAAAVGKRLRIELVDATPSK